MLTIYAYSSFQSYYGPGPELVKSFEKKCHCKVKLKNIGDAGLLLQRLKLEKKQPDLVIGLDQFSLLKAKKEFQWQPISLQDISWDENLKVNPGDLFIPFNWAPLTFLYRKGKVTPVTDLKELKRYDKKILLQDPSSSSPGFHFLNWINVNFPKKQDRLDFLKGLKNSIYKIAPSWTGSYGLFNKNKAPIVFTYLTSIVYHQKEQGDYSVKPMVFSSPHPVQIEYLAIPQRARHKKLAEKFVQHMLEVDSQKIIMNKNYMFPVVKNVIKDTPFAELPKLETINNYQIQLSKSTKKQKLTEWMTALGDH